MKPCLTIEKMKIFKISRKFQTGYPSQWQMMQTAAGQGMTMTAAASQRQSTAGAAPQQIAFLQGPQRRSNQAAGRGN